MTKPPDYKNPIPILEIGSIIEVDGTKIIAELSTAIVDLNRIYKGDVYPIGQFGSVIKIHFGMRIIYAHVARLRMKSEYNLEKGIVPDKDANSRIIEANLFGEGEWIEQKLEFERGVTTFPLPQQSVYITPRPELKCILGGDKESLIDIGEHVGSGGARCYADMNELIGKHAAILGATGSGKSGTVATILHAILDRGNDIHNNQSGDNDKIWKPKIIILDPHNEYETAFKEEEKIRLCTDEDTLKLPYWLFNFEETLDLFVEVTQYSAHVRANILKAALLKAREDSLKAHNVTGIKDITVDSPIPYNLDTLEYHIKNSTNMPDAPSKRDPWQAILDRIKVLRDDSRYGFIMDNYQEGEDDFPSIIKQFLRDDKPVCIIDLSGVPSEIAGVTGSAIARTVFAFKIWQTVEERKKSPILMVCEEAHRYVPNTVEAQYKASQDSIRRIAKEGRKYGIGLFLVSQRPAEVEPTVLSQCNSWIVLRITNNADREQVQGALPDSLAGLTKILSGLRRREAIFVGQAASLPSRILITDLDKARKSLPRSHDIDFQKGWQHAILDGKHLNKIINKWRAQTKKKLIVVRTFGNPDNP